eukprot:78009-Pelagomonas_calceolata.AAC.1
MKGLSFATFQYSGIPALAKKNLNHVHYQRCQHVSGYPLYDHAQWEDRHILIPSLPGEASALRKKRKTT